MKYLKIAWDRIVAIAIGVLVNILTPEKNGVTVIIAIILMLVFL